MTEVAKRAEVSISTVSHVLNGTANITDETKKRVQQAIDDLQYVPNALARGLRQRLTRQLGILVPDLGNEFYARCASGVLSVISNHNYTAMICDAGYDPERERASVLALLERRIDGLIFFGGSDDENVRLAIKAKTPVVLGDRAMENIPSVEFNNVESIKHLIAFLVEKGYRRIGLFSESLDMINIHDRYDGYCEGLKASGLPFDPNIVITDRRIQMNKPLSVPMVMREYLSKHTQDLPEVFICSNDVVALGVMEELKNHGFSVPEQVGIIGFDDLLLAQHVSPSLSTVSQDAFILGKTCFTMMQAIINNQEHDHHICLKNNFILRDSLRIPAKPLLF